MNESGAGGGMIIGRETEVHKENPPQCHTLYNKPYTYYLTWDRTWHLWWESGDCEGH
jgi:hypothetical protein